MKRKSVRKILALMTVLGMAFTMSACSSGSEEEAVPTASPEAVVTAEPTATPEATATPEPSATPFSNVKENGAINPNEKTNLITGEDTLTDEAKGKRSVAVMVNNALASLPQYGISSADLIYEIPVEGDITRLMAVYGDITQVPDMCSIRSCRYYYPLLAVGMDSVYIHWGIDPTVATETVNNLDIDRLDGNYYTYDLFDRDQERLDEGYALEHTSVFYGTKLYQALTENKVRTDLKEGYTDTLFQFSPEKIKASGNDCNEATVTFCDEYYSTFKYDSEKDVYYKEFSGNAHIDGKTEEQLNFTNVLFLETEIGYLPDDTSGRRQIDVNQKDAKGYLMTGGRVQEIKWTKDGDYSKIKIYDQDGNELLINTGKTYIAICNPDSESFN